MSLLPHHFGSMATAKLAPPSPPLRAHIRIVIVGTADRQSVIFTLHFRMKFHGPDLMKLIPKPDEMGIEKG